MNKFITLTEEDKKEWVEIKIKIPKNTIALIVNYIEQNKNIINMGNNQYDTEDLEKMKNSKGD